jgi:hypothetical protein
MSQVIANALPTFKQADREEAERIVQLAMGVEDGKQATENLKLATTEVASAETLVGKLNAINNGQPFTMPLGERLPTNDDTVDGVEFDGENWIVAEVSLTNASRPWLDLKREANDVYKARHLNDDAIDASLDLIAQHREAGTMTFSKNTIRPLKNGQYAINIAGRMGKASKSASGASSAELIAYMKREIKNK